MYHKKILTNEKSLDFESRQASHYFFSQYLPLHKFSAEAVDMNGRFQMQGGKNWILPK
jgi:hypothetical protein